MEERGADRQPGIASTKRTPTIQITLTAGINWNPDLFVREYYSYSLAECGLFAGGCDYKFDQFKKFKADTQVITIGTNLIYDVFPKTLTDFYTLEQVQENGQFVNKYRLAWGGSKKPFPTLLDADGDGLRGDLDPDDKTAIQTATACPTPLRCRTSGSTPGKGTATATVCPTTRRCAGAPARIGPTRTATASPTTTRSPAGSWSMWTRPTVTKRTWVTANPLVFDTDGDGLSDQQERVLGVHPRARNTDLSVLSIRTSTNQTGSTYLAPSQTIAFTSTVRNDLRKPVAYGLLEAEILNSAQVINPITLSSSPSRAGISPAASPHLPSPWPAARRSPCATGPEPIW